MNITKSRKNCAKKFEHLTDNKKLQNILWPRFSNECKTAHAIIWINGGDIIKPIIIIGYYKRPDFIIISITFQ